MNLSEYRKLEPNLALAKRLKIVVWVLSATVLLLVGLMRQIKIELPVGVSLKFLPAVHASLNCLVTVLLVAALVAIRRQSVALHKTLINAAMSCSALFLLGYVAYHFTNEETSFGGTGLSRPVYYFLLLTHVVSAAASFPFILYTWVLGVTNQFEKHRRFAKWVFPVWLYVAITGPICYAMLAPYYAR